MRSPASTSPDRDTPPDGAGDDGDGDVVSPELRAEALRVRLGGRVALDGVDAHIGRGWTAVIGPNGAGKSTLLRTLAGLLRPDDGRVLLDGRPLVALGAAERARAIAWLAQSGEVTGELSARDTVALGRIAHLGLLGVPGPDDEAAIARAMALTECEAWTNRRLRALSGGERQRVLVARALATEAPVLLLDEPTTHLDAPHQVALARLFSALAATRTVVTVLHDLPIALAADRLLVMRAGHLVAAGPPREPSVREAIGAVFDGAVHIVDDASGQPRAELVLDASSRAR